MFDFCAYILQVRIQTMPTPSPGEKPMFTGTLDCFLKTVRNEVRALIVIEMGGAMHGQLQHECEALW